MTVPDAEISKTFTEEQIRYLKEIYDACKVEGASIKSLVPLGTLIWISWQPLSPEVRAWAEGVAEELREQ